MKILVIEDKVLEELISKKLGKVIDPKALADARETAHSFHLSLTQVLLDKSLIKEEVLGEAIADYLGFPYINLKGKEISQEVLNLLPEETARHHQAIPFEKKDGVVSLAMVDPKNFETIDFVEKKTDLKVKAFFTLEGELRSALLQYKVNLREEFQKIIEESVKRTGKLAADLERAAKELPVIRVLDTLLEYGIAERASDIHIEGIEENVVIRFRLDGVLHDMITLPKELQAALIARVKILSNLKIDEHRLPQDGRFKFSLGETDIALRVSIIPTFFGENVVLRILPESERPRTLAELGLTGRNLQVIEDNLKKTQGMILVTGPTGSGKTTTLYSLLNLLNSPEVKICTIEDPIEYGIRRISQTQVNLQTGLTFANGLRSLLRHDPDIMMVGEIRDADTANIAIHSALTGHLVLSTLHTNDAPSAIPRFLDLGAKGFLIASTVNVVVAQRLVRMICRFCVGEDRPKEEILKEMTENLGIAAGELKKKKFYKGEGCSKCRGTGFSARIGIYEVFEMTLKLQELVLKQTPVSQLNEAAMKEGMTTMLQDGLEKATSGVTTLEEVLRVTRE